MSHPALRPKWLLGHLVALGAIVLFLNLGFWQLDRMSEKQNLNSEIKAMLERQPVSLLEAEGIVWEQVFASGQYSEEEQVLIRSRSQNSISGFHVVTPLEYAPGKILLVNRGFVPLPVGEDSLDQDAPVPLGEIQVLGQLRETQVRGSIGAKDPEEGVLEALSRVDVQRIASQTNGEVFPLWLQLVAQTPPPLQLPDYVPEPELDSGPHLAYAIQWFLFTLVVVVGYPLILRRAFTDLDSTTQS